MKNYFFNQQFILAVVISFFSLTIIMPSGLLAYGQTPELQSSNTTVRDQDSTSMSQLQNDISELRELINTLNNKTISLERTIQDTSSDMATDSELGAGINGVREEFSNGLQNLYEITGNLQTDAGNIWGLTSCIIDGARYGEFLNFQEYLEQNCIGQQ